LGVLILVFLHPENNINMRRLFTIIFLIGYSIYANSQILYLDNWRDIEGLKKISVSHYSVIESLGEIDMDKQLIKIVGYFNEEGVITEEKLSFETYKNPDIYHFKYDENSGRIIEALFNYEDFYNDQYEFSQKVNFEYNESGDIQKAELWCNTNGGCHNSNYGSDDYAPKSEESEYHQKNWLLELRYLYSYGEKGYLTSIQFEGKCCDYDVMHSGPEYNFNVYNNLKEKLFEFHGSDPERQLLNYSIYPYGFKESDKSETEIQLFKLTNSNRSYLPTLIYGKLNRAYDYTFNSKGDWTKCIVFDGTKPVRIIIRDLEYYN
jgi:hypothetical protein